MRKCISNRSSKFRLELGMSNETEHRAPPAEQIVRGTYEVIAVGAGHAGCEAALACARMGRKTLLLTMNPDSVALIPPNPPISSPAKLHLPNTIHSLCVATR